MACPLETRRAKEKVAEPSGPVSKAGKRAHFIQGQDQARGFAAAQLTHCAMGIQKRVLAALSEGRLPLPFSSTNAVLLVEEIVHWFG